ncbi:rRNA maturation RNase YbeY [uncultured Rhodospira sp.]|uniref:rRNA maturation RNase YbeY n=1 Tax=uncultured Rhodospira sp. TaxID=1936189 RepID=UPI003458180D
MTANKPAYNIAIDVVVEAPAWRKAVRGVEGVCEHAARAALVGGLPGSSAAGLVLLDRPFEVCVALEDDASVQELNRAFRGQDKPTNVLSFAALEDADGHVLPPITDGPDNDDDEPETLGDVIIAFETTRDEAARDGKPLADHLSHLVVHGVLHLLGHDHIEDAEARRMERLETRILAALGIADPYADRPDDGADGADVTPDPPGSGTGDHERPDPE